MQDGNRVEAGVYEIDKGMIRRFVQPIRPGDVITAITKVTNIRELPGKTGKRAFITFDIRFENQSQEMVAECR